MREKVTYLIVGGVVYLFDVSIFAAVIYMFPGSYAVGNVLAKAGGALLGFILHDQITFSGTKNLTAKKRLLRYCLLWLFTVTLAVALLYVFIEYLYMPEMIAKIISDIIVIIIAFLVSKYTVFK